MSTKEPTIARESTVNPINATSNSRFQQAMGRAIDRAKEYQMRQIPRYEAELNRLQKQLERFETLKKQGQKLFDSRGERMTAYDGEIARTKQQIEQYKGYIAAAKK